jgi:hypothetical protein
MERLTSRKLQAGSRLVLVVGVNKRPDQEINYGSGEDVSEESLADDDDKVPVKIRWYGTIVISRPGAALAGVRVRANAPRGLPTPPSTAPARARNSAIGRDLP